MSTYYDRTSATHVDGSPIFKTEADEINEDKVADVIERAWRCRLVRYGALSIVDWFAERDGRIAGYLELKSRTHPTSKYPTVYLSQKKWLALHLLQLSGQPSIFVVKFTDDIRWIRVNEIDPRKVIIGGLNRVVKSRGDIEPVIEVPVSHMTPLTLNPKEGMNHE